MAYWETSSNNNTITGWDKLSQYKAGVTNVTEEAIIAALDKVLSDTESQATFGTLMFSNNLASMKRNVGGGPVMPVLGALMSRNLLGSGFAAASTLMEQALVQPNVAGIPISSSRIETAREIEVAESMVIVQSTATKQYWTDNAVPRLKEWTVNGYLTSASALDNGAIIKPSLQWQIYYLDVCAKSRRPVLFKTNRGEFVKVQITNLQTVEEASYNNSIEVTLTLREYNPYFVDSITGENEIAVFMGVKGS